MQRIPQMLLTLSVISLSAALPARADPLTIISGSLLAPGLFQLGPRTTLIGTGGFTVATNVFIEGATRMDPLQNCQDTPDCLPGQRISLGAFLAPNDSGLANTVVTFRGVETSRFDVATRAGLALELMGSAVLPALGDINTTVMSPFTMLGGFSDNIDSGHRLVGGGTATLSLTPSLLIDGLQGWTVTSVRYDFEDSAPIPEPATVLLLGTGLAAVIRGRPRRRTANE